MIHNTHERPGEYNQPQEAYLQKGDPYDITHAILLLTIE